HLMLRKAQHVCAFAVIGLSLFTLSACGGGSGAPKIISISITPTTAPVPVNLTPQFVATVNLSNSSTTTNTTVTWQVNGVAGGNPTTIGAIAPSTTDVQVGIYTAPAVAPGGTDNGQVDITAVATQINTGTNATTTTVTSNTAVVTVGAGTGQIGGASWRE